MGHKRKLYTHNRSKGSEFLRGEYSKADLSITHPKPKLSDRRVIEALIRGRGFDSAKLLRADAFNNNGFSEPHRIIMTPQDRDELETRRLADIFARSVLDEASSILSSSGLGIGSPGEIRTPVDGFPPLEVQSPSLAGSFSTLASPLHHRATRDQGPGLRPNKPSQNSQDLHIPVKETTLHDSSGTKISESVTKPPNSRSRSGTSHGYQPPLPSNNNYQE